MVWKHPKRALVHATHLVWKLHFQYNGEFHKGWIWCENARSYWTSPAKNRKRFSRFASTSQELWGSLTSSYLRSSQLNTVLEVALARVCHYLNACDHHSTTNEIPPGPNGSSWDLNRQFRLEQKTIKTFILLNTISLVAPLKASRPLIPFWWLMTMTQSLRLACVLQWHYFSIMMVVDGQSWFSETKLSKV